LAKPHYFRSQRHKEDQNYPRASAEKFPVGGPMEKRPKNSNKDRKIALLSLFQGGGERTEKRPKNSTFKPLSTIFVPCMKI